MITYKTFLMYSSDGTNYNKLLPIKEFSDLGGAPETVETTTFDNHTSVYERGIQSLDPFEFTANYSKANYNLLHSMEQNPDGTAKEWYFAVWFGGEGEGSTLSPTGSEGKYKFKGQISSKINGAGVNDVLEIGITITPTTSPEFESPNSASEKTVTYDKNAEGAAGTIAQQSYPVGTVITLSTGVGLTAPSGKHFTGWATSSSGTVAYQGGASFTIPNADTVLYAVWADNT